MQRQVAVWWDIWHESRGKFTAGSNSARNASTFIKVMNEYGVAPLSWTTVYIPHLYSMPVGAPRRNFAKMPSIGKNYSDRVTIMVKKVSRYTKLFPHNTEPWQNCHDTIAHRITIWLRQFSKLGAQVDCDCVQCETDQARYCAIHSHGRPWVSKLCICTAHRHEHASKPLPLPVSRRCSPIAKHSANTARPRIRNMQDGGSNSRCR